MIMLNCEIWQGRTYKNDHNGKTNLHTYEFHKKTSKVSNRSTKILGLVRKKVFNLQKDKRMFFCSLKCFEFWRSEY